MNFPEQYRYSKGFFISEPGQSGAFIIPLKRKRFTFKAFAIASNGEGWDHVSVSMQEPDNKRCPTWEEMCMIKDLFFSKTETAIQYHPPETEYVNNHQFCLHLWRKQDFEMPLPPSIMVGVK